MSQSEQRAVRGRPPGVNGDETRRKLVTTARSCFAESGFSGTSNRQIAAAMGLTSGAIYYYFESKKQLYFTVAEVTRRQIAEVYRDHIEQSADWKQALIGLFEVSVKLNAQDPALNAFVSAMPIEARRHPELSDVLEEHMRLIRALFVDFVDTGFSEGVLADGVDRDGVVDLLIALLAGLARLPMMSSNQTSHGSAAIAARRLLEGTLTV